jgi:hypothetical protein
MKKSIFPLFLLFSVCAYSQDSLLSNQRFFSLGLSSGYGNYPGNNFIAKTYNPNTPFRVDMQFNVYKNVGFGIYYKHSESTLKTTEYVGNSIHGKFGSFGFYLCYYWNVEKKWLINPKVGVGTFQVKNQLAQDDPYDSSTYTYKTRGGVYTISTDINYFVFKWMSLFANLAYNYIDLGGINASTANGTSYVASNEFDMLVGLKVWLRR